MLKNIVFLPGWSFKADIWREQKDYFSRLGPKIILCEPRDLENCLKNIKLEETVFIAWSLGWFRLLELLKDSASLPRAIIGVSSAIRFKKPLIRLIIREFQKEEQKLLSDFNTWLFSEQERKSAQFNKWNKFVLSCRITDKNRLLADLFFLKSIDLGGYLGKFNIPIFLISGREDRIFPLGEALRLKESLPKAEITIMDAAHMPFLTKGDDFNGVLEVYIKRVMNDF